MRLSAIPSATCLSATVAIYYRRNAHPLSTTRSTIFAGGKLSLALTCCLISLPPYCGIPQQACQNAETATVRRYLAVLSHAFTIAVEEWQWVEENPVRKASKPKEPRGRVRYLSNQERHQLLGRRASPAVTLTCTPSWS